MDGQGKSHAKLLVQERTGREVEELLRELYIDNRLSHQEIADALTAKGAAVHRRTVAHWLADFGITRDDRRPVTL